MAIGDIFKVFAAREEDLLPPIVPKGFCDPLLDIQDVLAEYRSSFAMVSVFRLWDRLTQPHTTIFKKEPPCLLLKQP